jgi:HNH endonuclease
MGSDNHPKPIGPITPELLAHFNSKIDKTPGYGPKGECWRFIPFTGKTKYGLFRANKRTVPAHRFAYIAEHGETDLLICHACDCRGCVRIDHLFAGTNDDNVQDMMRKGRHRVLSGDDHGLRRHPERAARGDRNGSRTHPESRPRGDKHGTKTHPERIARGDRSATRLHPESYKKGQEHPRSKVTDQIVREMRALAHTLSHEKIGKLYGISRRHAGRIINGQRWGHVI